MRQENKNRHYGLRVFTFKTKIHNSAVLVTEEPALTLQTKPLQKKKKKQAVKREGRRNIMSEDVPNQRTRINNIPNQTPAASPSTN